MEKGGLRRSGQGGAGVDHWQAACTNPCSKVSPEEYTRAIVDSFAGYDCGPLRYVQCQESWDALLDCERMGVQIRDVHDEFEGAAFRDDKTEIYEIELGERPQLRVDGREIVEARFAAESELTSGTTSQHLMNYLLARA